jgi:hypothetical protein
MGLEMGLRRGGHGEDIQIVWYNSLGESRVRVIGIGGQWKMY